MANLKCLKHACNRRIKGYGRQRFGTDGQDGRRRRRHAVTEPRVDVAEADWANRCHLVPSGGAHSIGNVIHVELAARAGAESLVHGARATTASATLAAYEFRRIDLKFFKSQSSVVARQHDVDVSSHHWGAAPYVVLVFFSRGESGKAERHTTSTGETWFGVVSAWMGKGCIVCAPGA